MASFGQSGRACWLVWLASAVKSENQKILLSQSEASIHKRTSTAKFCPLSVYRSPRCWRLCSRVLVAIVAIVHCWVIIPQTGVLISSPVSGGFQLRVQWRGFRCIDAGIRGRRKSCPGPHATPCRDAGDAPPRRNVQPDLLWDSCCTGCKKMHCTRTFKEGSSDPQLHVNKDQSTNLSDIIVQRIWTVPLIP